jgi:hypothetical protein
MHSMTFDGSPLISPIAQRAWQSLTLLLRQSMEPPMPQAKAWVVWLFPRPKNLPAPILVGATMLPFCGEPASPLTSPPTLSAGPTPQAQLRIPILNLRAPSSSMRPSFKIGMYANAPSAFVRTTRLPRRGSAKVPLQPQLRPHISYDSNPSINVSIVIAPTQYTFQAR